MPHDATTFPSSPPLSGFLQLLAQLTVVGDVSRATFEGGLRRAGGWKGRASSARLFHAVIQPSPPPFPPPARLRDVDANPDHTVFVIEDAAAARIVGTAALLIEKKFIRGASAAAHVEDVVVDSTVRGQKLGARLVGACVEAARAGGCYKLILDCSEANVPFYTKCGLTRKEVQMVQYM